MEVMEQEIKSQESVIKALELEPGAKEIQEKRNQYNVQMGFIDIKDNSNLMEGKNRHILAEIQAC